MKDRMEAAKCGIPLGGLGGACGDGNGNRCPSKCPCKCPCKRSLKQHFDPASGPSQGDGPEDGARAGRDRQDDQAPPEGSSRAGPAETRRSGQDRPLGGPGEAAMSQTIEEILTPKPEARPVRIVGAGLGAALWSSHLPLQVHDLRRDIAQSRVAGGGCDAPARGVPPRAQRPALAADHRNPQPTDPWLPRHRRRYRLEHPAGRFAAVAGRTAPSRGRMSAGLSADLSSEAPAKEEAMSNPGNAGLDFGPRHHRARIAELNNLSPGLR